MLQALKRLVKTNGNGKVSTFGRGRHVRRAGSSIQGTLSNWANSILSRKVVEKQKSKISDRARDLIVNDATASGLAKQPEEVVNIGITPVPAPRTRFLGKDQAWESEFQAVLSDYFTLWGLSGANYCDVTRRQSIYMLQALALFSWKITDGIAIFQVVYDEAPGRPLGLSLLPIDAYRLQTPSSGISGEVYDGLELSQQGTPEAAYIMIDTEKGTNLSNFQRIPIYNELGFPNLLLVCDVRFIAEYRQESILGPVIKRLKDLGDTSDAALVKTLISNLWVAAATSEPGYGQQFYTALQGLDWEDRIKEVEKGTILQALPGEKIEWYTSSTPGPHYKEMIESVLQEIGMSTGKGYENVTRQYNASYSASRCAMLIAEMFSDADRMVLNNRFNDGWNQWLIYELAMKGKLPISASEVNRLISDGEYAALTNTDWLPPPVRPIDPYKDAKADEVKRKNNLETRAEFWGRKSKDWKAQERQLYIEAAYNRELEAEFGFNLKKESADPQGPDYDTNAENGD